MKLLLYIRLIHDQCFYSLSTPVMLFLGIIVCFTYCCVTAWVRLNQSIVYIIRSLHLCFRLCNCSLDSRHIVVLLPWLIVTVYFAVDSVVCADRSQLTDLYWGILLLLFIVIHIYIYCIPSDSTTIYQIIFILLRKIKLHNFLINDLSPDLKQNNHDGCH